MVQKVNVTLDNASPLIHYSPLGAWQEGDDTDQFLQQYYNGTYTQTTQFGASASLAFNGTSVWIYGSKRSSHAPFNTTLDDTQYFDTNSSSTNLFKQLLFAGAGLASSNHAVSITDSVVDPTKPYLDIDIVVYEVEIPDGYEQFKQQDTDDAFKFSSSGWVSKPGDASSGVEHVTSSQDAYVVYTFEGAHVEIYGSVGPDEGIYTVQVDNGNSVTFNGTKSRFTSHTLLYQDNSLVPGEHTLNISNSPFTGQTLRIDYAIIYRHPSSKASLSGGAIGGIAVGVCAGLLLALFGAFLWWRRRRGRPRPTSVEVPPPTDYSTGPVTFHTPSLPAATGRHQTSTDCASADPSLLPPPSTLTSTPSSPHSNSSGSSRLILHNPSPSLSGSGHGGTQSSLHEILSLPESAISYQVPGHMTRPLPQPGQSNTLVATSALVLAPIVEGNLRTMRMQVEGRSQDFGPVTFLPDTEHDGNLLPPDYNQAVEPFPQRPR